VARYVKQPRELLREEALAPHARPETCVVELPATQRSDPLEHLLLPPRLVAARILSDYTGGAFSVGPYHAVRKPYENLSIFFNFNVTVGTVPGGLFGQMLLVDRESYRRVGGHETVRGRILENFWLAEKFRAVGIPVCSKRGRGAFSFRMYPNGRRELIEGWTKGFASGAGQTPRGTLLLAVAWMSGLMLPPILYLATGDWLRWGAVYLPCAAQVAWLGRLVGAFR